MGCDFVDGRGEKQTLGMRWFLTWEKRSRKCPLIWSLIFTQEWWKGCEHGGHWIIFVLFGYDSNIELGLGSYIPVACQRTSTGYSRKVLFNTQQHRQLQILQNSSMGTTAHRHYIKFLLFPWVYYMSCICYFFHALQSIVAIENPEWHMFKASHCSSKEQLSSHAMITLLLLVRATYMYGVVLHAHPVRGESHNQRNTTGEVATPSRRLLRPWHEIAIIKQTTHRWKWSWIF